MSVDLSQINSTSQLAGMVSEMELYARAWKLNQEQIPLDDLSQLILMEIFDKEYSERKRNVRLGALDSLIYELRNKHFDSEDLANHLRQIFSLLI